MQNKPADDMNGMRVDPRNLTGAAEAGRAQESQSAGRAGRSTPSAISSSYGGDRIDLSSLSRTLDASESARSSRIAGLAAQYQAGQYQPDPAEISRSMVSDAIAGSTFQ
jgi:hypothetical protein